MSSAEESSSGKSLRKVKSTKYYDLLNIQPDATDDQIRKAYKKMSLKLHPDKALRDGADPKEVHEKFTAMKEAHEVLSDKNKRQIYDRMGEEGIKSMEAMANMDMEAAQAQMAMMMASVGFKGRLCIVLMITIFFGLLLLLPIFVCVKTDGDVDWSWLGTLSPLFVVDFMCFIYLNMLASYNDKDEPLSDDQLKDRKIESRIMMVRLTALILQHIFLFLRLDGDISWNWLGVLAPWIAWEVMDLVGTYRKSQKVMKGTMDEQEAEMRGLNMDEQKQASYWILSGALGLCRVVFVILVALGANQSEGDSPDLNDQDEPWSAAFVPVWVYFGISIFFHLVKCVTVKSDDEPDEAHDDYTKDDREDYTKESKSGHASQICFYVFLLMIFILLFERVQRNEDVDSSIYIIVPFLIIFGCLCCCMSCMVCVAPTPEDFEAAQDQSSSTEIPPNMTEEIPPPSYQGADNV